MTTHTHSRLAYELLTPKLNERQKEVLAVYNFGDFTDKEVKDMLGLEINQISGRVKELVAMNRLHEVDTRIQNGRKVRVCGLPRVNTLF